MNEVEKIRKELEELEWDIKRGRVRFFEAQQRKQALSRRLAALQSRQATASQTTSAAERERRLAKHERSVLFDQARATVEVLRYALQSGKLTPSSKGALLMKQSVERKRAQAMQKSYHTFREER